jgi:RNA polymerase sigma-70 factor (ECF subfamily)
LPERPLDPVQARRFEQLVMPHLDAAYRLAYWLARNEADAQDVAQDAYVCAWRFFGSLRGDDAKPWLMRIVRNQWLTRVRSDARKGSATSLEAAEAEVEAALQAGSEPDGPEHGLLKLEDGARVREAMAGLPEEYREVLVLREVEEMTYREVAQAVDAPIGTVMSRLSRARKLLGQRVRKLDGEAPDGPR